MPARAQQPAISSAAAFTSQTTDDVYARDLFQRIFGTDSDAAADELLEGQDLANDVAGEVFRKAASSLEHLIETRRPRKGGADTSVPKTKTSPVRSKRRGFVLPAFDWRSVAFGFQPLQQEDKPAITMTESDTEIKAHGSDKKSFETKEAKGTRTQNAETIYAKDGKIFGVKIKDKQIIEAVSKIDGKSFRQERSMEWGATVAACPDANGITAGTGEAKVISKTTYTDGGSPIVITSEFDLKAKLTGYVGDDAAMKHYDMLVDAYTTNSGQEQAVSRNLIKEVKLKDGRYGLQYNIRGNTIEISDGTYGGSRTPAKSGSAEARTLTPMPDADSKVVESAISKMIPAIWNSANEMYSTAQRSWRNYGCVEVATKAGKTRLKEGERVSITAETVHLQDAGKVNANLSAEAYSGQVTPEEQSARPAASFDFTQEADEPGVFTVRSVSKRGIGEGLVEFSLEKEPGEPEAAIWTGTLKAVRKQREEKEKRSGANLAENGGHVETTTDIQLRLTGRLDRTVEAANAHTAEITGSQVTVDHEYDRYKIDEGYCGPNAVPYKGPKEITRTSTTTAEYGREIRVFVEASSSSGTVTFSLPEANGTTLHRYVHKSPCSEHDRVNTNEAVDEEAPTAGGSFSFSFPIDPVRKTAAGTVTIREEDGSTTTYTWELSRKGN